jgi:antitoxin HigA-1
MRMHNPPHPGSVLRDYLGAVSVTNAARHLGVTRVALSRLLNGSAGISAEMALRLSDALGTSPELWTGMQSVAGVEKTASPHSPACACARRPPQCRATEGT